MALGYLLEPFIQINTIVGTPVVGAKIYVYKGNTTVLATTYKDFEGHLNTNPVRTNTLGNCTIIADDSISYDIEIRDALGLLLMSKKNITIGNAASSSGDLVVEAGYGIEVTRTQGSWKVAVDTDLIATQDDLADKQDKLQAGANIEITNDNTINVVNRREIVSEWPIKMERGNNRVKFYIDDDYANQFKTKQDEVNFGGGANEVITYIAQNENGELTATTASLPQAITYTAGTGISIEDSEISCTGDITPYTAGPGISISDHQISVDNISIESRDFLILNESHTLTAEEVANKRFSITIPGNISYWNWAADAKFTSHPIATINIGTIGGAGSGEVISSDITNIYEGGSSNSFARNQQNMYNFGIQYIRTWLTTKPENLDYQRLDIVWNGNSLSENDQFLCSIIVQASKLVIS